MEDERSGAEAITRVTTHVLYLAEGCPAEGLAASFGVAGKQEALATAVTDSDGRIGAWSGDLLVAPGQYWLSFDTGAWFASRGSASFYPSVEIHFIVGGDAHYHVPLLLSPFGYSTYRGS